MLQLRTPEMIGTTDLAFVQFPIGGNTTVEDVSGF